MPAYQYLKRFVMGCGKECITLDRATKTIKIYDNACLACLNRAKQCPDNATKVVKLPSNLKTDTVHRYGLNSFKLHGLPMPRPAQVLGMLGCNGTGKSTALQILAGKLKPNLGQMDDPPSWTDVVKYYRGSDLQNYFSAVLEDRLKVSLKPQLEADFAKKMAGMKVADIIAKADQRGKSKEIMEKMDLEHLVERDITDLSGGELQRLAISICALKKADVYMFDEPSSFLDVKQRLAATRLIRSLVQDPDTGESNYVIVVEHDLAILDYISDYIHCLYGEPGAYGVVTKRASVRNGINQFLDGYFAAENMRFRPDALSFKVSNTSAAECRELGLGIQSENTIGHLSYKACQKVLQSEGRSAFKLNIEAGDYKDGEILCLIGENGMGKTTFMHMLAGVYDVAKGTADEGGQKEYDCTALSCLGQGVTMSYKRQDFAAKYRRYPRTVRELLEKNCQIVFVDSLFLLLVARPLRIEELYDLPVASLSGGELQRLAIVVTLGSPAMLYLFDEPSAGLDCEQRVVVAKVIRRWVVSHLNRTCFLIEHDCLMISAMADRMLLFTGQPGIEAFATKPMGVLEAFNGFLKILDVTFRRDPCNARPRINKEGSVKDKAQKSSGDYFSTECDDDDD
eukprot:TRINITY_DN21002_c0_g3_i1.p1 TRINITY_DN21002_c0_g3~~TRINITY_DN21002_c0_g3_i1.p1  ORF type:complete len:694 (+),score=120.34 TRINITY_DN21002_c0_g3_i1:208-2082(+)